MKKIDSIIEEKWIREFLIKRWLIKQYKINKIKLVSWYLWKIDFKERKPNWSWIFSFRINKQFRAIWYFRWNTLIVIEINNHQNK